MRACVRTCVCARARLCVCIHGWINYSFVITYASFCTEWLDLCWRTGVRFASDREQFSLRHCIPGWSVRPLKSYIWQGQGAVFLEEKSQWLQNGHIECRGSGCVELHFHDSIDATLHKQSQPGRPLIFLELSCLFESRQTNSKEGFPTCRDHFLPNPFTLIKQNSTYYRH